MPIVVSIREPHADAARAVADRVAPAADLLELRVDRMERFDAGALLEGRRKPTIVACPGPEEGGAFAGSVEARLDRLRAAAAAGASFVDVDWRVADRLTSPSGGLPGRCRRIVSYHADAMPPDLGKLLGFLRALAGEGDFVKIVPRAERLEDALALARLAHEGAGRVIAFATGPAAMASRLLAVAAGSPLVYAAPAAGSETAPGQPTVADLRAALPPGGGGPSTAVYAVVGKPVGHSISPPVHSIAHRVLGYDAMFLAFEPEEFGPFLERVTPLPFVRGLAVTAPFKEDALRGSDRADETAKGIAAANTLVRTDQGWRAANTDDDGAADAMEAGLGGKLIGARVLVLGTGGAARAAAAGARRRGAAVTVAGRNRARAEKLAKHFRGEAADFDRLDDVEHSVMVNATPVGQWPGPDESPVRAEAIRPGSVVVDAVVRPLETALGRMARERGARFVPGVEWFLAQAARQLHLFLGVEPPLTVMRAAALDAVKREPRPLPGLVAAGAP